MVGVFTPWILANTKNQGFSPDSQLLNIYYRTTVPFIYFFFFFCPLHLKKSNKAEVSPRQVLLPDQRQQADMHFKKETDYMKRFAMLRGIRET